MNDETLLHELKVWLCDVQASDASPARGQMIDVAWSIGSIASGFKEEFSSLVALADPRGKLPRRISSLTGISTSMLRGAPAHDQIAGALVEAWANHDGACVSVAHYARYERPFFEDLISEQPLDLGEFLCTHAIAKRVLPGLPRSGIRALAGYFGAHLPEHKRSEVHVMATRVIWHDLVELLADEHDVHTLGALRAFLRRPAPKNVARTFALPRETRLGMPRAPGVYRMLGRQGEVLYVGKATSLKQRINSYFTGKKGEGERKLEMATQVWDVSVTQVDTPLEAALLEAFEIKRFEPPYNQLLRSHDRQPWWVHATQPWRVAADHSPDTFSLGPTSERDMFEAFEGMVRALEHGSPGAHILHRLHDEQVFIQGLALWRHAHALKACEVPAATWWWTLGATLIDEANVRRAARRAARQAARDEPVVEDLDEEDEQEERVEWTWTPEAVRYALDGVVRRTTRHVLRGHLLSVLPGARISWCPSHGPLAGQHKLIEVPDYGAWESTTLPVLDSLRVLVTELKRLCAREDTQVEIVLVDGTRWEREALWGRLQWV